MSRSIPGREIWRRFLHSAPPQNRTYADAITALNTLQSNHAIISQLRTSKNYMNLRSLPEMHGWLSRASLPASLLHPLNSIHIAGTKGKGSVSSFVSSILAQYTPSPTQPSPVLTKIGLYTSPHLRFVRERIQLNNAPVSEDLFAHYFFNLWDHFSAAAVDVGKDPLDPATKPVYFRYLTIMAFQAFLAEGVDTAVIECGLGGEYDSTNVIPAPTVVGITSLGIDHTPVLGETIEEIAWHKAGIMKSGAAAYTAPQPEAAMGVLRKRAEDKGVELRVVALHPQIEVGEVKLGLPGSFQRGNASLAVEIAREHLSVLGLGRVGTRKLPGEFLRGLEVAKLGGRCETRREEGIEWRIDGAHTLDSIRVAAEWFAECGAEKEEHCEQIPRVLVFNQQTRAGIPLLREIHGITSAAFATKRPFTHAIFCSNETFVDSGYRPDLISMNTNNAEVNSLEVQYEMAEGWKELCGVQGKGEVVVVRTIEEAVARSRHIVKASTRSDTPAAGASAQVLVTGSVHLIGGLLEVLETGSSTPS